MPATARQRGLADPFDPLEAIAQSAKLLRDLRREFGNLGLAAAAYNAGPGRVRDWLAGRRGLPRETGAYVRLVTGQSAEQWTGAKGPLPRCTLQTPYPVGRSLAFSLVRSRPIRGAWNWSEAHPTRRRLPLIADAGEVRLHPGGPGATHRPPWARARQHGLGAGPRRGGKPHERREIVREPASRRRELRGATQLNPGTDPTCASTGASILTLFHFSRRRGEDIVDRSNDSPIENGYALRREILPQTGAEFDDRVQKPFKVAHSASRKIMQHHDGPGLCTALRERAIDPAVPAPSSRRGSRSTVRRTSALASTIQLLGD